MLTLPAITVAVAVRDTLLAQGQNSLAPWFATAPHNNFGGKLPGAANGPPAVPGQHPYTEFDIYPKPPLLGVGGNPANPGVTNRGVHRILVGIPVGGAGAHAGVGRWFYTADHYETFVGI
jgi:hypothetical protein